MSRVKVTHRIYNKSIARFEYVFAGYFKGYSKAVEAFAGEQDWLDKKWHRFKLNGDLYLMTKED